jgi:hypothetical protein
MFCQLSLVNSRKTDGHDQCNVQSLVEFGPDHVPILKGAMTASCLLLGFVPTTLGWRTDRSISQNTM